MPASFRIGDAEMSALDGEPYAARVLYFEMRRRMDFETGLVGAKKGARVSWQAFIEALYIEPGQGITGAGSPSKAAVRRLAERLVRAGLIRNESRDKHLIIRCRLADCAPKKPGTNPAQTRHTQPGTQAGTANRAPKASQIKPLANTQPDQPGTQAGTNPAQPEHDKPGTLPVSEYRGGSSRELSNLPRAHVDTQPAAFFAALNRLAADKRLDFRLENSRGDPRVRAMAAQWTESGAPVEEFETLVRERLGKDPALSAVAPAYFAPVVADYLAGRQAETPPPNRGTSPGLQGARGAGDLEARAKRLGVTARPGESWEAFKQRVDRTAQRDRQGKAAEPDGRPQPIGNLLGRVAR